MATAVGRFRFIDRSARFRFSERSEVTRARDESNFERSERLPSSGDPGTPAPGALVDDEETECKCGKPKEDCICDEPAAELTPTQRFIKAAKDRKSGTRKTTDASAAGLAQMTPTQRFIEASRRMRRE